MRWDKHCGLRMKKDANIVRALGTNQLTTTNQPQFTVNVKEDVVFWIEPSVAVTVRGYGPGMVEGVIVTVEWAVLVESAWEVAVMVALVGSPAAIVGAVYTPPALIDPAPAGETDQFTA